MDVRMPDGTVIQNVPDNITKAELVAKLQRNGMSVPADWLEQKPAEQPKQAPSNNDVASQLGLTLRAGLKGALALPAMGADVIAGLSNSAFGTQFPKTLPNVDAWLTKAGIPEPQTPTERIVSKGVELGSGGGLAAAAAGKFAGAADGTTRAVLSRLASDPGTQVVSGTSAGLAGQQAAENGRGGLGQFVASLAGGVVGALGAGGVKSAASGISNLLSNLTAKSAPQEIDRIINVSLQSRGVDPSTLTPAMRSALADDLRKALKTEGTVDEAALARLADYRRLGMTPTVGRVTLDPYAVTREQNAAKLAAATGVQSARLPQISNQNNATLLAKVDELNPIADRFRLGSAAVAPIQGKDAGMKAAIDALYKQARDNTGRSAELDGHTFTSLANQMLQKNLAPKLGSEVDNALNDIATGKTPLTVEYAEQLKTMLGRKARAAEGTQGDLAYAYGLVRKALDETPLKAAPQVNPGNLPAIPGTVPVSPAVLGDDAINAFNAARSNARQRFAWQESSPGVQAALKEGANADNFIRDQIISRTASTMDVAKLATDLKRSQMAMESVRSAIVQHLKESAIGRGNASETANFSGRGWNAAINDIGEAKLRLFFDKAEVEQLKSIGRVGTYETFQPRGSAVNNSNTAAAVADIVTKLADKIPFGRAAASVPLAHARVSLAERGLLSPSSGLVIKPQNSGGGLLDPLLLPMFVGGGLLAQP